MRSTGAPLLLHVVKEKGDEASGIACQLALLKVAKLATCLAGVSQLARASGYPFFSLISRLLTTVSLPE